MWMGILYHCHFSAYKEDNQLGSFLEEIRKVFKGELEHQTTLASNEERIKDIENDAADAMDDNPNSVSNTIYDMIKFFQTFKPTNIKSHHKPTWYHSREMVTCKCSKRHKCLEKDTSPLPRWNVTNPSKWLSKHSTGNASCFRHPFVSLFGKAPYTRWMEET